MDRLLTFLSQPIIVTLLSLLIGSYLFTLLAERRAKREKIREKANQEPRRKRTGYRSRFAPEPQIRIASPRASPQSSGEYVPYSIQVLIPEFLIVTVIPMRLILRFSCRGDVFKLWTCNSVKSSR